MNLATLPRGLAEWAPAQIIARLDERVIGQHSAKQKLAGALWWNQYRRLLLAGGADPAQLPPRQNVLLAGPSGTGKTLLVRTAAALFRVPCLVTSATSYSRVGYVGMDPEDMIGGLVQAAAGNVANAENGIVFLDEVDKLYRRRKMGGDVGGEAVQQMLLAFLDDTTAMIKTPAKDRQPVRTGGITFIAAGAFSGLEKIVRRRLGEELPAEEAYLHTTAGDFISYGLIPEFVARFPVRTGMTPLDRDQLREMLLERPYSPGQQVRHLFALHGVELVFDPGAVDALLELASGARLGARSVLEVLLDRLVGIINDLPAMIGTEVSRLIVDADTIRQGKAPWKVPGVPGAPAIDLDRLAALGQPLCPPELAADEGARGRVEELKKRVGIPTATVSARLWWEQYEQENRQSPGAVVKLADDLVARRASLDEFLVALKEAGTDNVQAVLHFLDFTRVKKEDARRRLPSGLSRLPAFRYQTGDRCLAGGTYTFDGYLDGRGDPPAPAEQQVQLQARQPFPPIASTGRACWWKVLARQ